MLKTKVGTRRERSHETILGAGLRDRYGRVFSGLGQTARAGHLSIIGTVWIDLDAGGERDTGEPGLGGWPLSSRTQLGQEIEGQTDADGRYRLDGLDAGGFVVEIVSHGGGSPWLLTYPDRSNLPPFTRHVMLDDAPVSGQDFGLHAPMDAPQFTGMAWIDAMPADQPSVRAFIDGIDCTGPGGIMPRTRTTPPTTSQCCRPASGRVAARQATRSGS